MPIHPAHMVPDGTIPKTYVHQEYPKWVKGVIVHSEGEEQYLLQASEGFDENHVIVDENPETVNENPVDENLEIVDEVTAVPDDQQNVTGGNVKTRARVRRQKS